MKTQYLFLMFIAMSLLIAVQGCEDMRETYTEFTKDGEILYIAKADSISIRNGKERVEISWLLLSDPKVSSYKIEWNNGADSIVGDVTKTKYVDTVRVLIGNLPEDLYNFDIFLYDDKGNSSIKSSISGKTYGRLYQESLRNRVFNYTNRVGNDVEILWGNVSDGMYATDIYYKSTEGDSVKSVIGVDTNLVVLRDVPKNATLNYRTAFIPEQNALDTFYCDYSTFKMVDKLIENGGFEEDFVPMRKPGSPIFNYKDVYGQPARINSYFSENTMPYWPKIDDKTMPTFSTRNGIWYLCNSDNYHFLRLYVDDQKQTVEGNKVMTMHNVGASHNTDASRQRGAETPFQYTLTQRISLDNNSVYTISFSYFRANELPGPGNGITGNFVSKFIVGLVSSTDTKRVDSNPTYYVEIPLPDSGDESWKSFETNFDLPSLISANPELDFSISAIVFGIQTKVDPESSLKYSMLPGQISIDDVKLLEKE
jgi:hypothetical protein